MAPPLEYHPPWYQFGNADKIEFAILYGLLAMGTIWIIEALSCSAVGRRDVHVTMTDVGALVAYRGASWYQLLKMGTNRTSKKEAEQSKSHPRKFKRRIALALFMRVIVIIFEVTFIVLAVPRSVNVYEHDVGSTELTLKKDGGVPVQQHAGKSSLESHYPCYRDEILYQGFSPSVIRDVCWIDRQEFKKLENNKFSALYNHKTRLFEIVSANESVMFGHFLRQLKEEPFVLNMSTSIVDEAEVVLKESYEQGSNGYCSVTISDDRKLTNSVHRTVLGTCNGKSPDAFNIFVELRKNLRTQIVSVRGMDTLNRRKKRISEEPVKPDDEIKIGEGNRPALCIYPALIVLGSLCIIHLICKALLKRKSVEILLYNHSKTCPGMEFAEDVSKPSETSPISTKEESV